MKTSIRGLRDHLHDYLLRAQKGEEIIITLNNRPVARLGPVEQEDAEALDSKQFLQELEGLRESLSEDLEKDNG